MAGELSVEKKIIEKTEKQINPVEKNKVDDNLEIEKISTKLSAENGIKEVVPISANLSTSSPLASNEADEKKREAAIDAVLADGLNDVFLKMEVNKQKEFKKKGEETVKQINKLLSETKLRVNKIIDLIREWLKFIPGINNFFLEQEAKIKADKIIKVKNKF